MARIPSDPNYSSPTFPRATAGTDLFFKEDVQALAAAMSTHVHDGSGKGLGVVPAAGSIPGSALVDGSITSAKIADGTIATADMALGAATTWIGDYQAVATFSTTSTGSWLNTPITVTGTVTGSRVVATAVITLAMTGGPGAASFVAIARDGATIAASQALYQNGATGESKTIAMQIVEAPSAGSHTWTVQVLPTTAGTTSLHGSVIDTLHVQEFKR